MEIIPVIDIKGGKAVHARQGFRERYQPLRTRLCPEGDPIGLAAALLSLYPFRTIYIADLDALMGTGSNLDLMRNLVARFPGTVFWIDRGWTPSPEPDRAESPWVTVLGTESLTESILLNLRMPSGQMILSLDFSAFGLMGPKTLADNDRFWPQRIILMSLARVGGKRGPDWKRLASFRNRWPDRQFVAAGGVRHEDDLRELASQGFTGALIATALHHGTIGASAIERLMSELGPP